MAKGIESDGRKAPDSGRIGAAQFLVKREALRRRNRRTGGQPPDPRAYLWLR